MKQNTPMVLCIQDLSPLLKVSPQTLRKRLKEQHYLSPQNRIGNRYYFTLSDCERFIAKNYSLFCK